VVIFVDYARDDRFPAHRSQVGHGLDRLRLHIRGPLLPRLMRPVAVVMAHVLAEHQGQVAFAKDQDPVQQLAAEGRVDALADGVHTRRLRQGRDDPQSFRLEHLPERSGEDRIAVVNQEPQRAEAVTEVHGEVAGLLRCPCPGRACGHPGQVQPAGSVLDEHQHVQPLEQHRLDDKEVTGDNGVRLGGEELPPGRTDPAGR
jgi:hypothetical protein